MNKNQKILLGVAAVGVLAYSYWKSKQSKAAFVGADGIFTPTSKEKLFANAGGVVGCPCKVVKSTVKLTDGTTLNLCAGGQYCKAQQ